MVASPHDPLQVPATFWQCTDVAQALAQRDIGHLFRLLRRYRGASQTRIGSAVGLSQGAVSPIMNGNQTVIAITMLERITDGLDMPDDSRRRLGLASKEDPMKRRTALGLGLPGALSPATLTTVLRESAAEAMDSPPPPCPQSAPAPSTTSKPSCSTSTAPKTRDQPANCCPSPAPTATASSSS